LALGVAALVFVALAAGAQEAAAPTWQDRVNLNTATRDEFGEIPGVGRRMVREFMEYRPYVSIRQFRREIGKYVSDEQVAAYEQYVFVPIDPNGADAETLQQLPGLDGEAAAVLIEGRPFGDAAGFLDKLASLIEFNEDDVPDLSAMLMEADEA
jgi:DNA uptake protein ComE-like DNA-binding protein